MLSGILMETAPPELELQIAPPQLRGARLELEERRAPRELTQGGPWWEAWLVWPSSARLRPCEGAPQWEWSRQPKTTTSLF